jgi:hypothetical protein
MAGLRGCPRTRVIGWVGIILSLLTAPACVTYLDHRADCSLAWGELARSGAYQFQGCDGAGVVIETQPISKTLAGVVLGGAALGTLGAAAGGGLGFLDEIIQQFKAEHALPTEVAPSE